MYQTTYRSVLGNMTLAGDGEYLTGLWFEGQKYYLGNYGKPEIRDDLEIFGAAKQWLDEYFSGKNPQMKDIKLSPQGTEFQKRVWQELLKIPYGQTTTYGTIAEHLNIRSGQAVGGAVAHNPISILIPCHRVIAQNGTLTGYAGGIDRKKRLLELEQKYC
ncbi:MAG: methylated-DNA--[protein]-cysteine S-methyltransferase [Lachnospiraceae bacterium]